MAERIEATREGRVWDVWIEGQPIHVWAPNTQAVLMLSAGLNSRESYAKLSSLAGTIAQTLNGIAGVPSK